MSTPRKMSSFRRSQSAHIQTSSPSAVASAYTSNQQQGQSGSGNISSQHHQENNFQKQSDYSTLIVDSNGAPIDKTHSPTPQPFIAALCYNGLEVTLAASLDDARSKSSGKINTVTSSITIILSRSRMTLQKLRVFGEVVGLYANNVNGLVSVVTSERKVFNFYPVVSSTAYTSAQEDLASGVGGGETYDEQKLDENNGVSTVFGKYFWVGGRTVDCSVLFNVDVPFHVITDTSIDRGSFDNTATPKFTSTVHISSSADHKLLIAHADQLAIFDVDPQKQNSSSVHEDTPNEVDNHAAGLHRNNFGEIVWTTRVRATISSAVLSGDGRAIAYVLQGEGVGVPYPFGIRTFIRDKEDGSNDSSKKWKEQMPHSSSTPGSSPKRKGSANVRRTGGITQPPVPEDKDGIYKCPSRGDADVVPLSNSIDTAHSHNEGIVYKSGPFLVHSSTVKRLSFRGLGLNHSNIYNDKNPSGVVDGNDLLLTCSLDGSMRVFAQGSWKMLLHWETPPGSRADWIHGITMANLGDLDPIPKQSKRRNTGTSSHGTSKKDNLSGNHLGSEIQNDTPPTKVNTTRNTPASTSGWQSQPIPNCAAGAWISELTFRGPYPALRLSRLSFLKSGGDAWAPAHFESVAAILPPSTILSNSVLHNLESMSMVVQGVWSAWNPWIAHPNGSRVGTAAEDDTLSGNAMALLGSVPHGYGGSATSSGMGDLDIMALGGTHSPPSELRLIAGHLEDKVVIMEFPLWGDTDFGAMELGSPLRYLLNLKESGPDDFATGSNETDQSFAPLPVTVSTRCACLDFESNILCAMVAPDRKNINLEWRKKGTMNIVSRPEIEVRKKSGNRSRSDSDISIASTASVDSTQSYAYIEKSNSHGIEQFSDWSISPLPLSLPSLHLPDNSIEKELISVLMWWPDENFGGPPRLFALTTTGSLILYEMPPPWSAQEPIMPLDDSLTLNAMSSFASEQGSLLDRQSLHDSIDDDDEDLKDSEFFYEVQITPHPDFGLGLRLESQADGMPAIAGSYKKHPLTGGRLPAERTGRVVLGDELITVNSVSLEGLTFDDIIATVRDVGSSTTSGTLTMKFRAVEKNRLLRENLSHLTIDGVPLDEGMELIHQNKGDQASVLLGANAGLQQEFGRIVAIVPNALPSYTSSPRSLVLLPWHYGRGAPTPYEVRGVALLVSGIGRTITASRVEVLNGFEAESSGKLSNLGSITLDGNNSDIVSLMYIKTTSDNWCVAACDENGEVQLVFIDVIDTADSNKDESTGLKAEFRANSIFNCSDVKGSTKMREYLVRAHSIELLGTMASGQNGTAVSVWTSTPFVSNSHHHDSEKEVDQDCSYQEMQIFHRGEDRDPVPILDFRWVAGGGVDAFPWLITFSVDSVVVHRRSCLKFDWFPVAEILYSVTKVTCPDLGVLKLGYSSSLTPFDSLPHLRSALRNVVKSTDEKRFLLSDWHPEAMMAFMCAEPKGPIVAIRNYIKGIVTWLSQWMDSKDSMTMHWDCRSRLASSPFQSIFNFVDDSDDDIQSKPAADNAASLMQSFSVKPKQLSENDELRCKLQNCIMSELTSTGRLNQVEESSKKTYSKDFMSAMNTSSGLSSASKDLSDDLGLPDPIKNLSPDELCFLWVIGELCSKPPISYKLDRLAEMMLLSVEILRQVKESKYEDPARTSPIAPSPRSFLVKSVSSSVLDVPKSTKLLTIASGACLAALLSDSQSHLLKACKKESHWTWDIARSLRIPFWLRSDDALKSISEEIAQTKYKESMDVVECALFYVITGNMRMLKTVAAADRKTSGRTFLQFVTKYNFSSQRGRMAAEKNAFSLLRKRKYGAAAAFFLLAEPPMMKSALNIIVTKMEDLSLALFVARLIKANRSSPGAINNDLTIGGSNGFSLRGFGGGGGFATMGQSVDIENDEPDTKYCDWKPELSIFCKDLFQSHAIPDHVSDPCLQCVDLLWLDRPNDAAMCLVGTSFTDATKSTTAHKSCETMPLSFSNDACELLNETPIELYTTATARVVSKTNAIFDFAVRPFVVQKLHLPRQVKWFASLSASRALYRRGIELPSMVMLPAIDTDDEKENSKFEDQSGDQKSTPLMPNNVSENTDTSSSIFDSFDAPPQKPKAHALTSGQTQSPIFDSFHVPPQNPKVPVLSDQISSSIFDSFDAPPQKPKVPQTSASAASSGQMSSSIFDSFGAPPVKQEVLASLAPQKPQQDANKVDQEETIADSSINDIPLPAIWLEWRQNLLTTCVARRLLREMARVINPLLGDVISTPMALFQRHIHPLVPYNANHVFQEACDGEAILSTLVDCLDDLCSTFDVSKEPVVEHALLMIGCPHQPDKILYAVLLHCLTGRADLAEDVMRDASQNQVQRCESLLCANDDLVKRRKSKHHVSSQFMRRQAAAVSYQLELCLWLHRGGAFPMSGLGVKESTVGVRIGYTIASWGRCHEALENMLKCEPDCTMDFERGRQIWSSMKMITTPREEHTSAEGTETTSGGWEFLVDCDREEATNLLRNRKGGSFLLRPNPEDHGIFTLSFRTNLKPREEDVHYNEVTSKTGGDLPENKPTVNRDDVVQHAIIRLSDAGFKCGSFGPFSSLLKLLEAVSTSLPFDLLFKEPPAQGIIKEEGGQASPNSVFIRKLALHSKTEHYRWNTSTSRPRRIKDESDDSEKNADKNGEQNIDDGLFHHTELANAEHERFKQFGMFSQLLILTELRKQFSAIVAAFDDKLDQRSSWDEGKNKDFSEIFLEDSLGESLEDIGEEEMDTIATRIIRPFLSWSRAFETSVVSDILPMLSEVSQRPASSMPVSLSASATAVEVVPSQIGSNIDCGDAIIRRMIQPRSGVEFRTLRVGEAGHSAVVVLFRKSQAIKWMIKSGAESDETDAVKRLDIMEKRRVIEQVDINTIAFEKHQDSDDNEFTEYKKEIRYRFVDPWEVETIESKDAELRGASLGRQHYVPFTIGAVARACEDSQRHLGGLHLLSLWAIARGGVCLTKALASVYPPWERDAGGDLQVREGIVTQPTTYANSFRQHLYRNALFRRLRLPQRFLAFIQVEILDLKNLTSPGGSPSVTAYALLRLKRDASNAPLTHKARTLDSVSTDPKKISRGSGPNAPASWGSVVRFRFPLPEGVNCDGVSFDSDREALFKGAPSVLQISAYEKKFMTNSSLGGADIHLDALSTSGQLEEWVPLRSINDEITWFVRLRLTLRFELMCLESGNAILKENLEAQCPSSGLRKMKTLSRIGGAHEDSRGVSKSTSSPDMVRNYFENMV